jgi:hypothetical protein
MTALEWASVVLYMLACGYVGIDVLHSIYFLLFISQADCIAATSGLVYVFCHTGIGISHFVAVLAWPWYWMI